MGFLYRVRRISFKATLDALWRMFLRFPFAVASTIIGTVISITMTEGWFEKQLDEQILWRLLSASALGVPLLIAAALFGERLRFNTLYKIGLQLVGVGLLVAYYFSLPSSLATRFDTHIIRSMIYSLAAYCAIVVMPFTLTSKINAVWHYNKALIVRAILAGIFSGTLGLGLTAALFSLQFLFGVDFRDMWFREIWAVVGWIVGPWFFLAGFPKEFHAFEERKDYPGMLRAFAQAILLPLLGLFAVIIYAYIVKILIVRQWPKGGVAEWIIGFSVYSLLVFLILYPLQRREGSRVLHRLFVTLHVLLVPLAVTLLIALGVRVREYGITPNRYFVGLGGLWLIPIALYFALSKRQNIKAIPVSLAIVALLSSFGPWGAFGVSAYSQIHKVTSILMKHGALVDGKLHDVSRKIPREDYRALQSSLSYLEEVDELERFQPWFEKAPPTFSASAILSTAGLGAQQGGYNQESLESFFFHIVAQYQSPQIVSIRGYEYLFDLRFLQFRNQGRSAIAVPISDANRNIKISLRDNVISVEEDRVAPLIEVDLSSHLQDLVAQLLKRPATSPNMTLTQGELTWEKENQRAKVKVYLSQIDGRIRRVGGDYLELIPVVEGLNGTFLLTIK